MKALHRLHSQRLHDERVVTRSEALKRLQTLDLLIDKESGHMSGSIPSPPGASIIMPEARTGRLSAILLSGEDVYNLPLSVECQCCICQCSSKYGIRGSPVVVDGRPSWTRTTPPTYISRRLPCKNCDLHRN